MFNWPLFLIPILVVLLCITITVRRAKRTSGAKQWTVLILGSFITLLAYFLLINLFADLFDQGENWAPFFVLVGLAILTGAYYIALALGALLRSYKTRQKRE